MSWTTILERYMSEVTMPKVKFVQVFRSSKESTQIVDGFYLPSDH